MAIRVFYDGACSLCAREIAHYRRCDRAGRFEWLDVNVHQRMLVDLDITLDEALLYLHVLDEEDQWHIGVDGFIAIWSHLPRWNSLAHLASMAWSRRLFMWLYDRFARWRFIRMGYCERCA